MRPEFHHLTCSLFPVALPLLHVQRYAHGACCEFLRKALAGDIDATVTDTPLRWRKGNSDTHLASGSPHVSHTASPRSTSPMPPS
jgi:hypothetical protein